MDKIQFPRRFRVYIPLLILAAVITFLLPRTPKFSYDYKKGEPWAYETLVAKFDFPILKTDLQLSRERERLASEIIPYYRQDASVGFMAQTALNELDLGAHEYLRPHLSALLSDIYSRGVLGENMSQGDSSFVLKTISVRRDGASVRIPVEEVYTLTTARAELRKTVHDLSSRGTDSLYAAAGLDNLVHQDLILDKKLTDDMYKASLDDLSTTDGLFKAHQTIIKYGDVVTAETQQLLDSYRKEYDTSIGYNGHPAFLWAGNAVLALCFVLVLFLAIYYCNYRIFTEMKKYLYLILMFTMSFTAASIASRVGGDLFYIIPFNLIALYLLAFFKKRIVFVVYLLSLLPILIFASNGVEIFVMYVVSGVVGMFVFERFNKGWLQFVTAFIVFVTMVLVWTAFRVVEDIESVRASYMVIADMALGALLMVAAYPLIYLFERIFLLVSTSKLVELSDTSNKLLRMLADKAPGTFQHSLQVMNLADAAARSIDANVPLVRAGALYHDIGKIANPQCFTENETPGVNFHADLSYKESAREIIRHVADGVALADKHRLPNIIKEFIVSHHGTTCTAYFMNKYLNEGGDPSDVQDFYYDGVRPTTKEQVILMLCDTIEAASRSLKDYSQENVSALVDKIIEGKVDECQLSCADISLRELNILKDVIKTYLMQMHHSRVAYPKRRTAGK